MTRTDRLEPLSLYERIELIEHFGNAQLKYLKRLYDRRPIPKRYLENELEIHLHFAAHGDRGSLCVVCHRTGARECGNETSVLVYVRQNLKGPNPVASVVRLQPLEQCDVFVADAFEKGRAVSLEELWRIVNRKLNAGISRKAGIRLRELNDEIVETAPQCVGELANHDANVRQHLIKEIGNLVSSVRIILDDTAVTAQVLNKCDFGLQLRQVLVCPPQLSLDFI